MVVEGDSPLGLVNSKHFGEVDEFRARCQMSEHRLINPGTLFIHSYQQTSISFPYVFFPAAWTLYLVDDVRALFQGDLVLRGAEET